MSSKPSNGWTEVKSRNTKRRQQKDAKREKWLERAQKGVVMSMDDLEDVPAEDLPESVYNMNKKMINVINKQGDLIESLQETVKSLRRDIVRIGRAAAVQAEEQFPALE